MKNKKLLFSLTADDFRWDFFCAGGNGGQSQQRNKTACRCVHEPSKAEGISRDERSQLQNKQLAFRRMAESKKFQSWLKVHAAEKISQKTVDEIVDEMMANLSDFKIEIKNSQGNWQEISLDDFLLLSAAE